MTTFENPLTNKTLAVYTLNIYEIDGKYLAKTYVDELREHLDMLGLKYKFDIINTASNEQIVRDTVPSLEQISQMEEPHKETSIVESLLSSIGLGGETSNKIIDKPIMFPEHFTGILTINLTIFENLSEPEKNNKAKDAVAHILNTEIYGIEQLKKLN